MQTNIQTSSTNAFITRTDDQIRRIPLKLICNTATHDSHRITLDRHLHTLDGLNNFEGANSISPGTVVYQYNIRKNDQHKLKKVTTLELIRWIQVYSKDQQVYPDRSNIDQHLRTNEDVLSFTSFLQVGPISKTVYV